MAAGVREGGRAPLVRDLPAPRLLRLGLTVVVPYLVSTLSSLEASTEDGDRAPVDL